MVALRHYAEQRFTCAQCGRCCRRGWDIAVTAARSRDIGRRGRRGLVHDHRRSRPTDGNGDGDGTVDPFEPIGGHAGHFRIRKRADGACGFLSPENRCRIHEQLGGARKPLTCRLFPFRFHPVEGKAVLSASFCCPTVVANEGEPVTAQVRALSGLYDEWARTYPEPKRSFELVAGRSISGAAVATLRDVLCTMLDHADAEGRVDVRGERAADGRRSWTTSPGIGVVKLAPERFAEYVELTGRYAAGSDSGLRPTAVRPPWAVSCRAGFSSSPCSPRASSSVSTRSGLRLGLRARLVRSSPARTGSRTGWATSICAADVLWPAGSTIRRCATSSCTISAPPSRTWGNGAAWWTSW